MTDVLYKYRSMSTPEAKEHTLDIIDNLRLYCAVPASFNDPFECQAVISFDAPIDIKNERAKNQLMKESPKLSEMEAARQAPQKWNQVEHDRGTELRLWLLQDMGVISFSSCKDDILMWSHYAGGHGGVCIEFRCTDKSHVDLFGQTQQACYTQQLPTVNFYMTDFIEKAKALILTKAEHWRYEKEWRIIVPDIGLTSRYFKLPTGIISAIYLGCRISTDNKTEILRRIKSIPSLENILVFQGHHHPRAYGLTFTPIRVP